MQDANRDGCIGWGEFEAFMMEEFAAGKHLLSGEYVLPSGETCWQQQQQCYCNQLCSCSSSRRKGIGLQDAHLGNRVSTSAAPCDVWHVTAARMLL
jgi:hypothetical protein